jgi:hypothetical protein
VDLHLLQLRKANSTFSVTSAFGDENILKTKVFLTFGVFTTGLSACQASVGKASNLANVAKKAGIPNNN